MAQLFLRVAVATPCHPGRSAPGTETALIRVTNDLLLSSDSGCISLLVLLDLIAAFDTIDHNILLNRLKFVGISGSALAWFKSYVSDRHQFVAVNEEVSYPSQVQYGVPKGSVLGPLLFMLYMLPLGNIIRKHGVSFHGNTGLAFTVMLMIHSSIFLRVPVKHTKLRN